LGRQRPPRRRQGLRQQPKTASWWINVFDLAIEKLREEALLSEMKSRNYESSSLQRLEVVVAAGDVV
jgi:hypothetical protein